MLVVYFTGHRPGSGCNGEAQRYGSNHVDFSILHSSPVGFCFQTLTPGDEFVKVLLDVLPFTCYHGTMHEERQRKEITRDELSALYMSARTVRDICAELGVTPKRLYHLLDAAGIARRRRQTRPTVYLKD